MRLVSVILSRPGIGCVLILGESHSLVGEILLEDQMGVVRL